jgi:hypothetical protein
MAKLLRKDDGEEGNALVMSMARVDDTYHQGCLSFVPAVHILYCRWPETRTAELAAKYDV